MKRSRHVTLILLGSTALSGCQDDRTAPPPAPPQRFTESLALPTERPRCDRPEDFPLPECHDPSGGGPSSPAQAPRSGHAGGGVFWFFHGGGGTGAYGPSTSAARTYAAAGPAVRAAAPAGTTSFGGFGAAGRAVAAFGGGE